MSAPLQGVNPVEDVQEGTEASAVEFIEDQTEYLTFKKGEEQDTVTAVCFLEEGAGSGAGLMRLPADGPNRKENRVL